MLDRMEAYRKVGEIMRRGDRPEDLLKNSTDEHRLYLLPMLISREMYGRNGRQPEITAANIWR